MSDDDTTTTDGDTSGDNDGAPPEAKFTTDDMNRIVQDRLHKERQKYADYEDLQAKAAKLAEIEEANQSELEKAQQRAEEAERKATEAQQRARDALVRSSVIEAATKANAVDADSVLGLLDTSGIEIGDDGRVEGVEGAVKALLEAKPFLVGHPPTPGSPGGTAEGGARGGTTEDSPELGEIEDPKAVLEAARALRKH